MRHMNYSTDDEHRETLSMLREACEYLERLPQVPLTKEVIRKLRKHLDQPTHKLVERTRREYSGVGPYTPAGYPLLEASFIEGSLTVRLPTKLNGADREWVAIELGTRLMHGVVTLPLEAGTTIPELGEGGEA